MAYKVKYDQLSYLNERHHKIRNSVKLLKLTELIHKAKQTLDKKADFF